MRYLFFLAFSCVAFSAFGGSTPDAPIWLWTPAERVGARLEHLARPWNGPRVQSLSVGAVGDFVIDGRTTPELIMPNELFNALLQGLSDNAQVAAVSRQTLAPGIRAFGFDEADFWTRLDQATSHYRDQVRARSREERGQTSTALAQGAMQQTDLKLCQVRAVTLQSVRRIFRTEGFDRFLYTVVAPTISITTEPSYETPEHLLSVERGCQ
jgi:hypothetical protein